MPNILLVEDEPALLENLEYVLEREEHTVLTAGSVNSALGVSEQYPQVIDILVSDVMLTPLDGAQLAVAIKAHRKNLAVILMSGTPTECDVADEFPQKPFPHNHLLQAINKCLRTIPVAQHVPLWSRAERGRFPEIKELKQLVRDRVAPGKSLGHSDNPHAPDE